MDHDDADPFVLIWEGPTDESYGLVARLRAAIVPVETDAAAEPGRTRVLVPQTYVPEALESLEGPILAADPDEAPETDDDDEDDSYVGPLMPAPMARILLAIVALGLVVLLILSTR